MERDVKNLERSLKALANRRRLAILRHLKKNKEASVAEIAGAIHISLKATSKHLGVLAGADIVEREQRSLFMFYRIAQAALDSRSVSRGVIIML
jgi:DNA-binding transcriptional ArsR family regulator